MPGQHQRRHPQPVAAQVESEAEQLAALLAPAVSRQQAGFEQAVGETRAADGDGGSVEAACQAQRPCDRAFELVVG